MDIHDFVASIIGQLVWSVKRGHGSFLTMEFGNPNLAVREPIVSSAKNMPIVVESLGRHVSIKGTWHLWVQEAAWSVATGEKKSSFNQDKMLIDEVLKNLDGQKVTSIDFEENKARLIIKFDLGGILNILPLPEQLEPDIIVWSLHKWNGNTTSISQNGDVTIENHTSEPSTSSERPLPPG